MNAITNLSDESGPDGPFIVGNRSNILSVTFVKSCQLAHRVSQTCVPSLSGLCGAVGGSSAGWGEFRLSWLLQVNTAALRVHFGDVWSTSVIAWAACEFHVAT